MTTIQHQTVLSLRSAKLITNSILRLPLLAQIGQGVTEVTRRAGVYISTRKVNERLIAGIFLVALFGPLADIFYTLDFLENFIIFKKTTKLGDWYYDNCFYVFLCIGPYLDKIITAVGLYLIFVQYDNPRSWLVTIPIAHAYARIFWLLNVNNDLSFHQPSPALIVVLCLVLASALWFITDYLEWRKYHRADSFPRRFDGLCQIADMNDPVQRSFVTTWQEMKAKNY